MYKSRDFGAEGGADREKLKIEAIKAVSLLKDKGIIYRVENVLLTEKLANSNELFRSSKIHIDDPSTLSFIIEDMDSRGITTAEDWVNSLGKNGVKRSKIWKNRR